MIAHIVAGAPHQGKTTFIKRALSKAHPESIFIYDVQNEYYGVSGKTGEKYFLYDENYKLPEFADFCKQIVRIRNGIIVLEECTIFLDPRGSNFDIRSFLVSRYHKNNYVFLLFHHMRAVPHWVYNLCDRVTLFKTKDNPKNLYSRFEDERLVEVFNRVKKSPKYYCETFDTLTI